MFGDDLMSELTRQVLRDRTAALIAEACAWSVGLSDLPHYRFRSGRPVPSGVTLGVRAEIELPLGAEEAGRLEFGDARPGSFRDALNALTADGGVLADRFDAEVLEPFVLETCGLAAERARRARPAVWRELLDDLGEDEGSELSDVVRAGEWDVPLRIDAEQLVLAALGDEPLIAVEAEGLPLSLVRAAEAAARAAPAPETSREDGDIAGALFLAESALHGAALPEPVPPAAAERLLEVLLTEGLEPQEIPAVLAHLPVEPATAAEVTALLDAQT
jgi:hypothetical protein